MHIKASFLLIKNSRPLKVMKGRISLSVLRVDTHALYTEHAANHLRSGQVREFNVHTKRKGGGVMVRGTPCTGGYKIVQAVRPGR